METSICSLTFPPFTNIRHIQFFADLLPFSSNPTDDYPPPLAKGIPTLTNVWPLSEEEKKRPTYLDPSSVSIFSHNDANGIFRLNVRGMLCIRTFMIRVDRLDRGISVSQMPVTNQF